MASKAASPYFKTLINDKTVTSTGLYKVGKLTMSVHTFMWIAALLSASASASASASDQSNDRLSIAEATINSSDTSNKIAVNKAAVNTDESTLNAEEPLPHVLLSPIVVMGEKQQKSLMDTASSVQVYDETAISSLPETPSLSGLLQHTANVVDTGNGNEVPSIRGVDGAGPASGAIAFFAGNQPRVNVSVDGRSLDYHELAFAPQSMWDVNQVEVFRGPQSYIQGGNAIAGAVVMKSADPSFDWDGAVKLSAGNHKQRQYAAMLTGPISEDLAFRLSADRFERESTADIDVYDPVGDPKEIYNNTIRGKLLYMPIDIPELSSELTLSKIDTQAPQREAYQPETPSIRSDARRPVFTNTTKSATWDLSWEGNSGQTFDNTITYTDFDINRLTALELPYANIDADQWSIEPRIQFEEVLGIESLSGMFGVRAAKKNQDEFINLFGGATFKDTTKTQAAYGEVTYPLSTTVDMTVGLRAQREDRRRFGDTSAITIDLDETYKAVLPKMNILWHPNQTSTYGVQAIKGYNPGGAGVTFSQPFTSYQYDPEYVESYELYTRQKLLDDRLQLTGNIFYNDYKDMQLPYTLPNSTAIVIKNADKVVTYGAEVGADWQIKKNLIGTANIGLLNTNIKQYPNSGLQGNRLLRAPKFTANAGVRYELGKFDVASSLNYNSGYYSDLENQNVNKTDDFWSMNAELGYQFDNVRVSVFGNNIFDNDEAIIKYNNGLLGNVYQQPATFGVTLDYDY